MIYERIWFKFSQFYDSLFENLEFGLVRRFEFAKFGLLKCLAVKKLKDGRKIFFPELFNF